jgi:hypothetical protein
LHEGALEHHTRNVAELESKHRRLEHIVETHLPAHLGKVPPLDRQHTPDTFADLFRELLGHLIEHAEDAKAKNKCGPPKDPLVRQIIKTVQAERKKRTPWNDIPNIVAKKHGGRRLSVSTLKDYVKPSKAKRI